MTISPVQYTVIGNSIYYNPLKKKKQPPLSEWMPKKLQKLPAEQAAAELVIDFFDRRVKAGKAISNLGDHLPQSCQEALDLTIFNRIPELNVAQFKEELTKKLCHQARQALPWYIIKPPKSKEALLKQNAGGLEDLIEHLETKYGQKPFSIDDLEQLPSDKLNELMQYIEQRYGPDITNLNKPLSLPNPERDAYLAGKELPEDGTTSAQKTPDPNDVALDEINAFMLNEFGPTLFKKITNYNGHLTLSTLEECEKTASRKNPSKEPAQLDCQA